MTADCRSKGDPGIREAKAKEKKQRVERTEVELIGV